MSRILLCGAFGQANPGDDALLAAFIRALDGHDVVVAAVQSIDDPRATTVPPSASGLARVFGDIDAVVVGGGTVFKTLHPSAGRAPAGLLGRTAMLLCGARIRGIPLALVGVGAGELGSRTAGWLARWVADHAALLVLRDEESASVLRGVGATPPFRIGADPAWTLFDGTPTRQPTERVGVVVAISHLAERDLDRLCDRLVRVVEPLNAQGVLVRLQPWQADAGLDATVADRVARRLGSPSLVEVIPRPRSLPDAVDSFSGARAVIGLRHHSLVAAAVAGCPFLAVSHEPKLSALARRLGQNAVPAHASPAVLARAVLEVLSHDAPSPETIAEEIAVAHRSMRLLRVVVSGGADDELVDHDQLSLTSSGLPW